MSETVHYRGNLTPIECPNGLESMMRELLDAKGIEYDEEDLLNFFNEEFWREYYIYKDTLYSVEYIELNLDEDMSDAYKRYDKSISFELKYYNGGASFDEMLDKALDKLE